jgi:hypothetical protein
MINAGTRMLEGMKALIDGGANSELLEREGGTHDLFIYCCDA